MLSTWVDMQHVVQITSMFRISHHIQCCERVFVPLTDICFNASDQQTNDTKYSFQMIISSICQVVIVNKSWFSIDLPGKIKVFIISSISIIIEI